MSSFHPVFSFLRVTYRSFPSPYPVSVSYSVIFRASSNLPRLFEAFVCRVRLTDWPNSERAVAANELRIRAYRTYTNIAELRRTRFDLLSCARAPFSRAFLAKLLTILDTLIPSTYFYGLFERLSLKVTSFFPSISHSFEEFVHQSSTQLRERNKYGTFTWHIHVFRGCVNSRITRFWNFSTTLMFYDNDAN